MSLRDEMPVNTGVTFCGVKTVENEEMSYAVKTFLAQGGKITVVPAGLSKDIIEFNKTIESKKQAEKRDEFKKTPKPNAINSTIKKHISEAENAAKRKARSKPLMRPENRAKSGRMNIHQKTNGAWVVTIKSMHIGTYDDEPAAIKARDDERRRLKLPEAQY
jgi:hypothetical protein